MIEALNNTPGVRNALLDIEDKLRERGFLVRLTADPESDVTLHYVEWGESDERGPWLVIAVDSPAAPEGIGAEEAEELSDYVSDKVADASSDWPADAVDLLGAVLGQVVLVNGLKVY